ALRRQKMTFSGPYELHQGGRGIVARFPVMREGRFWGFSSAVARLDTLFAQAGMQQIDTTRYFFQLSKQNPETGKTEYFIANQPNLSNKIRVRKSLPDGNWELHLAAKNSNEYLWAIIAVLLTGTVLSVLLGTLVA